MTVSLVTKRFCDVIISATALILLSPVLLGVGLLVRARLGTPVFFRQKRPGLGGRPFLLIKFRTMRDAIDASGQPLDDSERLTPFGKRLRASSLDEIPELWNVLRGDMSLVGPRPLLMEYLTQYSAEQYRRHEVRPGITGWAQVNGRNNTSWDERFAHDLWYVHHQSLALDLRILVRTVRQVFKAEGIEQPGHATMPRFTGRAEGQ
jgi:lipopolysaccharide/colanic/teichoic acid biosynthesis glycosyltransferase